MSRSRQPQGGERLHLHMGYFATLADAEYWLQRMRGAYPSAVASVAPAALLQQRSSGVPTLPPAASVPSLLAETSPHSGPSGDEALTDTRVLQILETRRVGPAGDDEAEMSSREISLLRPDDTDTRRVLREAVAQGAPASFAVQLLWSVQPIDLNSVPSLSIFRAYTLYLAEFRRDGRRWHCLRLGFFGDAISARQVAYYVRSEFASVAVVPISEQERTRGNESPIDSATLGAPVQQSVRQEPNSGRARTNTSPAVNPMTRPTLAQAVKTSPSSPTVGSAAKSSGAKARSVGAAKSASQSLEQTLELLAESEISTDSDSFSETGVRHLSIDFQKRTRRRS